MEKLQARCFRKVNQMKKLLLFAMALLIACAAQAMPTLNGPTGGFELPTAEIAPNGITVAVDQATNADDVNYPNMRALYGIDKNLEVGLKYEQFSVFSKNPMRGLSRPNTCCRLAESQSCGGRVLGEECPQSG